MRAVELPDPPAPDAACQVFLDLPHCALLESVGEVGELSRWSFLSADPFLRLESKGRQLTWTDASGSRSEEGDPFEVLARELARWREAAYEARDGAGAAQAGGVDPDRAGALEAAPHGDGSWPVADLPPFRGGVLGYFGYDLLHHLERVPPPRYDDLALPDLDLGFHDWTVAWDRRSGRAWVFSTGLPERGGARDARATRRLDLVLERLESARAGNVAGASAFAGVGGRRFAAPLAAPAPGHLTSSEGDGPPTHAVPEALHLRSTFSRAGYLAAVERAREYVLAGDIFQVNLSQRLSLPYPGEPLALYRRLRSANPAPFAAFLAGRDAQVLSASPERFLRVSGDRVETRPIKGTAGRGYTPAHDFALRDDLVASEKDRSENVMIVDLLRNDLSRVAVDGTVRVPDLWRVERHPTVHHLVSTVTARLRSGISVPDVLRAAFPGGSITGAPKVRATEIIHELEPTRRGVYCGSIGYVGFDGEADLSIAIRTLVLKNSTAYFSVGGAIVADSDPASEYRETLLKGAGLMRACTAPVAVGD